MKIEVYGDADTGAPKAAALVTPEARSAVGVFVMAISGGHTRNTLKTPKSPPPAEADCWHNIALSPTSPKIRSLWRVVGYSEETGRNGRNGL